jgi:hypothetical protein
MHDELDIPMPASGANFRVSRRRPGMDPNTKRLLLTACAIGGTLVVLVGAWSLTGHRSGGLPVVEAASGPLRVKPADPGGMTFAGKDASILSGKPDGEAVLAPPPEAPALQALREQAAAEEAARAAAATKLAAAQQPPPPKPAPAAVAQATPPAVAPHAPPAETVAMRLPPVPRVPPAAPPRPAEARATEARPAEARRTEPRPAAHGGTLVQLAALQSEAAAMAEWHRLERRMPGLLNGKSPSVMKVEHDGRVFYRLRTGGFSGNSQAGQFCSQIKAKGGGCTIASF